MQTASIDTTPEGSTSSTHGLTAPEISEPVSVGLREGQATRRTFTNEYKRRVVAEYEAAPYGEKGALLRREKLYDTQLSEWRQQVAADALGQGHGRPSKPGRPAASAEQKRVRELEQQLAKAEAQIVQKDQVIADRDAALEVLGKGVAFLEALTSKNAK